VNTRGVRHPRCGARSSGDENAGAALHLPNALLADGQLVDDGTARVALGHNHVVAGVLARGVRLARFVHQSYFDSRPLHAQKGRVQQVLNEFLGGAGSVQGECAQDA